MKKNMFLGLILVICGNTYADSIKIPDEYKLGTQINGDEFYILDVSKGTTGKDVVVYMHASLKEKPQNDEIWMTQCFNSLNKGLVEFKCTLDQKDFYLGLTNHEKIAIFDKKNISAKNLHEVNYKIDSDAIISEKYQLLTPYKTDLLIRKLLKANKFSYSWKASKDYNSQEINMRGFYQSYNFAKKMLEVNK